MEQRTTLRLHRRPHQFLIKKIHIKTSSGEEEPNGEPPYGHPKRRWNRRRKDLGEDADATLYGDLRQEEVIGQEPFLKPPELEQPPENRRFLELKEPLHD